MLDSSNKISRAILQRSRTSASLMHSHDFKRAIYLSRSEFLELPKPPPYPKYFESEPPRFRDTRLSFMAICMFAVDDPSPREFSSFSVILISTFLFFKERPEAPDLILPSNPTAIESMPAN